MRHVALLLAALLAVTVPAHAGGPAVILATTTSTQDTGLLDVLVPAFERAKRNAVPMLAAVVVVMLILRR